MDKGLGEKLISVTLHGVKRRRCAAECRAIFTFALLTLRRELNDRFYSPIEKKWIRVKRENERAQYTEARHGRVGNLK